MNNHHLITLQSGDDKDVATPEGLIDDSEKKRPRERKDVKQKIKRSKPAELNQVQVRFVVSVTVNEY